MQQNEFGGKCMGTQSFINSREEQSKESWLNCSFLHYKNDDDLEHMMALLVSLSRQKWQGSLTKPFEF